MSRTPATVKAEPELARKSGVQIQAPGGSGGGDSDRKKPGKKRKKKSTKKKSKKEIIQSGHS